MNRARFRPYIAFAACAIAAGGAIGLACALVRTVSSPRDLTAAVGGAEPFIYSFNVPGALSETDNANDSPSPYWWLDSGGRLVIENGVGETIQGDLAEGDPWQEAYAKSNPTDTDNGLHPQNLFRLLTKGVFNNATETASFLITNDELSKSPNRNESNGLLLMSRYEDDGQTLYYAGVRVDGTAVIKKKYEGQYYTMAQAQIFPGTYDPTAPSAPSGVSSDLIPHDAWIGLKTDTVTNSDGSVTITLSMKLASDPDWVELLSATDAGTLGGTPPILGPAPDGIRTDFMDVEFKDFEIEQI